MTPQGRRSAHADVVRTHFCPPHFSVSFIKMPGLAAPRPWFALRLCFAAFRRKGDPLQPVLLRPGTALLCPGRSAQAWFAAARPCFAAPKPALSNSVRKALLCVMNIYIYLYTNIYMNIYYIYSHFIFALCLCIYIQIHVQRCASLSPFIYMYIKCIHLFTISFLLFTYPPTPCTSVTQVCGKMCHLQPSKKTTFGHTWITPAKRPQGKCHTEGCLFDDPGPPRILQIYMCTYITYTCMIFICIWIYIFIY